MALTMKLMRLYITDTLFNEETNASQRCTIRMSNRGGLKWQCNRHLVAFCALNIARLNSQRVGIYIVNFVKFAPFVLLVAN